jgi:hypothetical protein
MFTFGGLLINAKSPAEINPKVSTTYDILRVHPGKIEHTLFLGTGLA